MFSSASARSKAINLHLHSEDRPQRQGAAAGATIIGAENVSFEHAVFHGAIFSCMA